MAHPSAAGEMDPPHAGQHQGPPGQGLGDIVSRTRQLTHCRMQEWPAVSRALQPPGPEDLDGGGGVT